MPGMDRTGPLGQGPLTGRGFGRCRWNVAGTKPIQLTKEEEKKILEAEKAEIEKRLKELKN